MKKTNLLLSLCLAMASTSLVFGAARYNDAPGVYRLNVINNSPYNIEAIETFLVPAQLEDGKQFVYPWAGVVSGLSSGNSETIKVKGSTNRFPYIQANGVIYELARANGQPVHFKKGDNVTFFDKHGTLGAKLNNESLNVAPVFEGTYLEHLGIR